MSTECAKAVVLLYRRWMKWTAGNYSLERRIWVMQHPDSDFRRMYWQASRILRDAGIDPNLVHE